MSFLRYQLSIHFCLVPILLLTTVSSTAKADVSIDSAEDEETVRVHVDGELFAVVQRSKDWSKPFIYPVLRPGWSTEDWTAGHGIVVAETPIRDASGNLTGRSVAATTRVAVLEKQGDLLSVPDVGGYVSAIDVVPERALIVRTVEQPPLPYQRKNKRAYEHPHHRGIWVAVDEVNDIKFWNDGSTIRPKAVSVDGNTITLTNEWLGLNGEPLLEEKTSYQFHTSRLIVARITFTNVSSGEVTFDDTKEGLFGIRIATEMREREGGVISDSTGRQTETDVWGHTNRWVDYSGQRAGHPAGVTIFDTKANTRPGRYHVRGYGLFSISPFGPHAYSKQAEPKQPLVLANGDQTSMTYGLWIHGATDEKGINAIANQFEAASQE